jgi:ribosome-binding protein aMBF1 (putative translation factor)
MAERKVCSNKGCEKKFTAKDNRKKYCSTQCSQKARHKKYKQKKADQYTSQMTVSRGEHYEDYVKQFAEAVEKKLIQKQEVAKLLGISNPMVTKMHEAYLIDKSNLKAAANWETPKEALSHYKI